MVEAPYRRAPKGEAIPTVEDYKNMIDAAEQMKTILGQMTAEISAQDYLNTVKFLDQLAAEARGRIENVKAAPEQPAKYLDRTVDGSEVSGRDSSDRSAIFGGHLLRRLVPYCICSAGLIDGLFGDNQVHADIVR